MTSNSSDPFARDNALQPSEQRRLEEAEYFLENGKPAQAAPIFAKLAEVLTSASQPKRAAALHAQAALAFAQSRNEAPALMQARAGLNLFLQHRMDQAAAFYYKSINNEFFEYGMKNAVAALEKEFTYRLAYPSANLTPQVSPVVATPAVVRFPDNCPHCGAPVHMLDVTWVDDVTVECAYCSTPIRSSD